MIYLSPMIRGSELAFRMLCRQNGNAQLCYSPMLRDHDVIEVASNPSNFETKELKIDSAGRFNSAEESAYLINESTKEDVQNLIVQLCGSQPDKLAKATTSILDIYSNNVGILPVGIDLNLGCPQKCAEREGFGAYLVEKNDQMAVECLKCMRKAIDAYAKQHDCKAPILSAKIRLLDSDVENTVQFIKRLKPYIDLIAIHCRTRKEKHDGKADWEAGKQIVEDLANDENSLPVVLNGGVTSYKDAQTVLQMTQCHAVMVANGYLCNHRKFNSISSGSRPQDLALEYLDFAQKYPPPSYLYIQLHLRWIFRDTLQPKDKDFNPQDYSDYRVRLWTFLVRPYLRSIAQYRLFVALFVKLSGGEKEDQPKSIRHLVDDVTYRAVKKAKLN